MTVSMDKKYVTRNGLYTAKVVYIHDKGEHPVVVFAEHKDDGLTLTFRTNLNGREFSRFDGLDLIEVPEVLVSKKWQDKTRGFIEYKIYATGQGGKFPIHGAYKDRTDGVWKPISWKSDGQSMFERYHCIFDLIEVPEEKPAPTLNDYKETFDKAWGTLGTYREGIKAVLELAGVKVL